MGNMFPRVGVASMAACLKKEGIRLKVFDPTNEDDREVASIIKRFKPEIVVLPSFTSEIFDANETARFVKKINPGIFTIVGGPHPSALPRRTLEEFCFFDAAAFGEGEYTILDLAKGKKPHQVLGIAYRKNGQIGINKSRPLIELNDLPLPAWELFNLTKYQGGSIGGGFKKIGRTLEIPVEGARGCPFNCNFCFRINGKMIRFKNPEKIVEEVKIAVEKFGATKIHFVEGTFGVNRSDTAKMCRLLIESGLNKKISWSSGGRVNVTDEEILGLMKESGCAFLGYGVESGDNKMLKIMGKGITTQQITRVFNQCAKIGITTEANFILGHPFETEKKILKTIKFAKNLNTNYANFAIMVPFPGTEVYEMARKGQGGARLLTYDWRVYGKQIGAAMELEQLPREKLIKLQNKAYFEFFFTPKRLPFFLKRLTPGRIFGALGRVFH